MMWLVTMLELENVPRQLKFTALSAGAFVVHVILNLVPPSLASSTLLMTSVDGSPPPLAQSFSSTPTSFHAAATLAAALAATAMVAARAAQKLDVAVNPVN